jgi:hypothetical protein
LCAPIIPAAPLGNFGTESPAAPLGDFCTESLLEKTSILHIYCAIPVAPLGDFCTESLLEKTSIFHTYCAIPTAVFFDMLCLSFCGGFLRVYYMAPPH